MIEYEALLVTALLDLDPEQLGLPPVAVLDTPVRRASGGALRRRSTRRGGRARGARTGKPRGIPPPPRRRAAARRGPRRGRRVSSKARSRSTEKSARHASSLRPRPCSPAPSGAPPRRPAATRRSVPLSFAKPPKRTSPTRADDQPPPEAPEDDQDDPHDDEDPAKTDATVTASTIATSCTSLCGVITCMYPRWIREQNAIENRLGRFRVGTREEEALSDPPRRLAHHVKSSRMQSEMKRRLRFAFAIAFVVAVTVVAASAIAFAGRDAKAVPQPAPRRRAPAAAEQIRSERRDSFGAGCRSTCDTAWRRTSSPF